MPIKMLLSILQNIKLNKLMCALNYGLLISVLFSCSTLPIKRVESVNQNERVRFLVMHYTVHNYQNSLNALANQVGGASSHYLVPKSNDDTYTDSSLKVIQLVEETKRAWHAGISYWQGRTNLNDTSIGIEIVNMPSCHRIGRKVPEVSRVIEANNINLVSEQAEHEYAPDRFCFFPDFEPKQIELVIQLSKAILARNPDIGPTQVVAHSDISPMRKIDPGPRFPWYQLYKEGIGAWYEEKTVMRYWRLFDNRLPSLTIVQQALNDYGYNVEVTGEYDSATLDTLAAFQMHFLPWHVNTKLNAKTVAVLFALLEKYFPDKLHARVNEYSQEDANLINQRRLPENLSLGQ